MTQFSNKLKKLFLVHFCPIFPILGAKKIFLENPALSRTTLYGFLAPYQIFKKLMIQFKENAQTDGQRGRRKDGQTIFYRTLPGTIRGPKRKKKR